MMPCELSVAPSLPPTYRALHRERPAQRPAGKPVHTKKLVQVGAEFFPNSIYRCLSAPPTLLPPRARRLWVRGFQYFETAARRPEIRPGRLDAPRGGREHYCNLIECKINFSTSSQCGVINAGWLGLFSLQTLFSRPSVPGKFYSAAAGDIETKVRGCRTVAIRFENIRRHR